MKWVDKILHVRRGYHMGPVRIAWYLECYHEIQTSDATECPVRKRMDSIDSRSGSDVEPFTRIATRRKPRDAQYRPT